MNSFCFLTTIQSTSDRGKGFYKILPPAGVDNSALQDAIYSDGIFDETPLPSGTRVLVVQPMNANEANYIIKVISNNSRQNEESSSADGVEGQQANWINPTKLKNGERVLKSDYASIKMLKNKLILDKDGSGISIYSKDHIYSTYFKSTNNLNKTAASISWSGYAYRNLGDYGDEYNQYMGNSCNVDELYHEKDPIGYSGSKARRVVIFDKKKNSPIPITRSIYFDKLDDYSGDEFIYEQSSTNSVVENNVEQNQKSRRDYSTCLTLAPEQLIEVVYGNLPDSEGSLLGADYKPLLSNYDINNKLNFIDSSIYNKRAIGFNFQLSTDSTSNYSDTFNKNFFTSITKEGFLTVNLPKTTNYGTIPYSFNADFSKHTEIKTDRIIAEEDYLSVTNYVYFTTKEKNEASQKIATLTKEKVFPEINENSENPYKRSNGLLFKNFGSKNKGDSDSSKRVMITKYHNMYSAAEMLFANKVEDVVIPRKTKDDCGYADGSKALESFQIPSEFVRKEINGKEYVGGPTNRSYVVTNSSPPAIKSGGGIIVCGSTSKKLGDGKPYTNDYKINDQGKIEEDPDSIGFGGYSANLNFDGALLANLGKDNANGASMIMDTAGSIISWIGRDKQNRSVVMQTDGSVSLNIGTSKKEGKNKETFFPGRFDMRVNLTPKKNLNNLEKISEDEKQALISGGDFILSISEKGIVFSGMNKDIPMLIKNEGDLCLESGRNIKLIAGIDILQKKPGMPEKTIGNSEANKTVMTSEDCKEDLLDRNYINEQSSGNIS